MTDRSGADHGRLRRIRVALLLAALATLALLWAPQPVLPQLADHFHLAPAEASLTVSATTAGLALAGIPLAAVSQVVGRRRLMVCSLLTATVVGLLLPLATSLEMLVVLRAVQGVAIAGVPAVAMAYAADEVEPHQVAATMGIYVAGTSVGGMAGRLLAGVTADVAGWRGGLLAVALGAGGAAVSFMALLPGPRHEVRTGLRIRPLVSGMAQAVRDPVLYGPYLVGVLGMGSFVAVYNVLSFRLVRPPLDVPPALASLAFLAYVAGSVTSTLAGLAAGRLGRPFVLLAGIGCTLTGLAVMLPDALVPILVGLVVFTGGFFCVHAVASGWVAARAAPAARSQASAVYLLAYYVGSSVGGTAGSVAYGTAGWTALTGVVGCWLVLAVAATVVAALLTSRHRGHAP